MNSQETDPQSAGPAHCPRPQSKTDLFFSFSILALQGFGGVLAIVQRELVEKKRWLTQEEFLEDWAVAQILPGPNVVNPALFGGVADTAAVQGALRGMGAVAAGLITATGIKLVGALKRNVMGLTVCWGFAAVCFVASALLRVPLVWVLLCVGGLACIWAYRQLGNAQQLEDPL